jgi:hypothetical protein
MDLTIVSTGLLLVGELASIPIRHPRRGRRRRHVGALFVWARWSAVGFLVAGAATVWSVAGTTGADGRCLPPEFVVALPHAMTKALPSGVAVYGTPASSASP